MLTLLKKNQKTLFLVLCLLLLINTSAFATPADSKVGQELKLPDAGWKRIDNTDSNIVIENLQQRAHDLYYNETLIFSNSTSDSKVKFSFTGSKIRLIGAIHDSLYSDNIKINIDGVDFSYSQAYGDMQHQHVIFEKLNLANSNHSVVITVEDGKQFDLDAIDLDEDASIIPYEKYVFSGNVFDFHSDKTTVKTNQSFTVDLIIDNISEISAEDLLISYDNTKLTYVGSEETEGIKKVIEQNDESQLRFILASKGSDNIINSKTTILKLTFIGHAEGEALIDVVKARVSDGISVEKNISPLKCDEITILVEGIEDVDKSGAFTLLDLAIDARYLYSSPSDDIVKNYNTDIEQDGEINDLDLIRIAEFMLQNENYSLDT